MQTGLESYDFAQKRIWRKWNWNSIKKILYKVKTKNACGLFLVGPDPIDYKIAIGKGFTRKNLIGIDLDDVNIKKFRDIGGIGIKSKLQDVILCWGKSPKLDFINADFCCGFTSQMDEFLFSCVHSDGLRIGTVMSINFFRGRDKINCEKEEIKNVLAKYEEEGKSQFIYKNMFPNKIIGDPIKHRGLRFLHHVYNCAETNYKKGINDVSVNQWKDANVIDNWGKFLVYTHTNIMSYKSGNNIMDSVVFTWPFPKFQEINLDKYKKTIGKIAAAKAVRTMRM